MPTVLPSTIATTDPTGGEPFRVDRALIELSREFTCAGDETRHAGQVDGRPAVVPSVTGMADRTGEHVSSIDPHDPLVPRFLPR